MPQSTVSVSSQAYQKDQLSPVGVAVSFGWTRAQVTSGGIRVHSAQSRGHVADTKARNLSGPNGTREGPQPVGIVDSARLHYATGLLG